jgi:hypothetical protein
MPSVTLELSEELRARVEPFSRWLPAILELSLLVLKTPAFSAASELIEFLVSNPSPGEMYSYHLPNWAQERIEVLLENNSGAGLSDIETRELDEYLKLEHAVRLIKAKLTSDELAGA